MRSSESVVRSKVWVSGRVQGVAYRAFARDVGSRMGLQGGVRNLHDGRVEVEVEGERAAIEKFLEVLQSGPPLARVDHLKIEWGSPTGQYDEFAIWY